MTNARWSNPLLALLGTVLAPVFASAQAPVLRSVEPSALRSVPAETTAAAYVDKNWKAPRTSWGHPSLEGVWSTDDMRGVPMNRPENFGTRDSLTPEEFLERASRDEGGADLAVQRRNVPAQRVGHPHLRLLVARRRSAERPDARS